ncbi:MAG: hypothetical protein HN348_15095 [Proteobacteria bacterium]|nr:hypothetical protein [Pseudomonadota bacterium]
MMKRQMVVLVVLVTLAVGGVGLHSWLLHRMVEAEVAASLLAANPTLDLLLLAAGLMLVRLVGAVMLPATSVVCLNLAFYPIRKLVSRGDTS